LDSFFLIPVVAILFWYKRYSSIKEAETQELLAESINDQEKQDKNDNHLRTTRGIVYCRVGKLLNFCTFNQQKLTGDRQEL